MRKREVNIIAGDDDFDPKLHDEPRVEPKDETLHRKIGGPSQNTQINASLEEDSKQKLTKVLAKNNMDGNRHVGCGP